MALSASDTTARATVTAAGRSAVWTVTTLMIFSAMCALMTLALLLDAACSADERTRRSQAGNHYA